MTGVRWVGVVLLLALVTRLFFVLTNPALMTDSLRLLALLGAVVLLVAVWVTIRVPNKRQQHADLGEATTPHDAEYEFLLLERELPVLLVTVPGGAERRSELFASLTANGWAIIELPFSGSLRGHPPHDIAFDNHDLVFRQSAWSTPPPPFTRASLRGPIPAGWGAAAQAQESAPLLLLRVGGLLPTPLELLHNLASRYELIGTRVGVVSRNTAG